MRQNWRELAFLHFSLDPAEVQKHLPASIEVETFEGRAWLGLVLFRMESIRPDWGPAAPWLSAFPETNVRTYASPPGSPPGVWFFSLDAARWLACEFARRRFGLPYKHAMMSVSRSGDKFRYHSDRKEPPMPAQTALEIEVAGEERFAEPGSLDHWLIERYRLYAMRNSRLVYGDVKHKPYPLREIKSLIGTESLIKAAGFHPQPWEHMVFSEGVDVDVLPATFA